MNAAAVSLDVVREMRAICGEDFVRREDVTELGPRRSKATLISVHPGSTDEVAGILRLGNQRGFSIAPVGRVPSWWVFRPSVDVALCTSRLTAIEHYDHADLTVGVGAGMTVDRLNALVGADKLMFACDPPFAERTTVGAVLAAAMHGTLRHGYGAARDFCIGIRFVTGDGRKAKAGGRVVKNVAGYDLMKLLIGSYGTLAVITSASFKLFPSPRQTRTFIAEFASWQEALKFRDMVMRSPLGPMCLELVSPLARKMMRPETTEDAWVICVRGAGSDAVLARYRQELSSAVSRELDYDKEAEMWRAIANFPVADEMKKNPDWRTELECNRLISITVPPAEVGVVLQALENIHPENATVAYIGRVAVGQILVAIRVVNLDFSHELQILNRDTLPPTAQLRHDGFVLRDGFSREWFDQDMLAQMHSVKRALDPNDVLQGRHIF